MNACSLASIVPPNCTPETPAMRTGVAGWYVAPCPRVRRYFATAAADRVRVKDVVIVIAPWGGAPFCGTPCSRSAQPKNGGLVLCSPCADVFHCAPDQLPSGGVMRTGIGNERFA